MAGASSTVDHTAESASGGFPPFDSSLFSSQIFWFWVAFGALYLVLASAVIPRIAKTLSARRTAIEGDLKIAADQAAAAQDARAVAEKAAADARAQARKTIDEVRAINEAASAKADAEASAKATAKIAEAETKIALARSEAITAINDNVGDLAASIVEQVSGTKPSASAIASALKQTSLEGVA